MRLRNQHLLNDERVHQEIERHKWIESQRAGYDIGYQQAADDWINRFAGIWLEEYTKKAREPRRPKGRKAKKKPFSVSSI